MDAMTAKVFAEAKIKLRQHSPPSIKLDAEADILGVDDSVMGQLAWANGK